MSSKISETVIRGILREAQRAHDHSAAQLMRAATRHLRAAAALERRLTLKSHNVQATPRNEK